MSYYDAFEFFTVQLIEKDASRVAVKSAEGDWWDTIQFLIEKLKRLKVDNKFRVDIKDHLTMWNLHVLLTLLCIWYLSF